MVSVLDRLEGLGGLELQRGWRLLMLCVLSEIMHLVS